jgi:hypothetical protein
MLHGLFGSICCTIVKQRRRNPRSQLEGEKQNQQEIIETFQGIRLQTVHELEEIEQ